MHRWVLFPLLFSIPLLAGLCGCDETPQRSAAPTDELQARIDDLAMKLTDSDADVRKGAVVSLLQINDPRAHVLLSNVLRHSDDSDVLLFVLKIFDIGDDGDAADAIVAMLAHEDLHIREAASSALARAASKSVIIKLAAVLSDKKNSTKLRCQSAIVLARTRSRDGVPPLLRALKDSDRAVVTAAEEGLEFIAGQAAGNGLGTWEGWWKIVRKKTSEQWLEMTVDNLEKRVESLAVENAALSKSVVAMTIEKLRSSADTQPLLQALQNGHEDVVAFAAEELGRKAGQTALAPLMSLATHASAKVRASVCNALGAIGDVSAQAALLKALGDSSEDVRAAAASGLGDLAGDVRADALLGALGDESSKVRVAAAVSLGKLKRNEHVEALVRLLKDAEPGVREAALAALGDIGNPAALEAIIGMLSDENERVRWFAVDALGKIGGERAAEVLLNAFEKENERVREAIVIALGKIGDERAADALFLALSDASERVRQYSWQALKTVVKNDFRKMHMMASSLYEAGKFDKAGELYATEIESKDRFAGMWDKLEDLARKTNIAELDASIGEAEERLARCYIEEDQWAKGAEILEHLVTRRDNAPTSMAADLAKCYLQLGRLADASQMYGSLLQSAPDRQDQWWRGKYSVAEGYVEADNCQEATAIIEDFLKSAAKENASPPAVELMEDFRALQSRCTASDDKEGVE